MVLAINILQILYSIRSILQGLYSIVLAFLVLFI